MKKYYIIKDANTNKYYIGSYSEDSWQNESYLSEFYSSKKEARKVIFNDLSCGLYQIIPIYKKD